MWMTPLDASRSGSTVPAEPTSVWPAARDSKSGTRRAQKGVWPVEGVVQERSCRARHPGWRAAEVQWGGGGGGGGVDERWSCAAKRRQSRRTQPPPPPPPPPHRRQTRAPQLACQLRGDGQLLAAGGTRCARCHQVRGGQALRHDGGQHQLPQKGWVLRTAGRAWRGSGGSRPGSTARTGGRRAMAVCRQPAAGSTAARVAVGVPRQ